MGWSPQSSSSPTEDPPGPFPDRARDHWTEPYCDRPAEAGW
jgi:hypothetical protein